METGGGIFGELILLAESLAAGVFLMAFYDGLRIFRLAVRHGTLWTGIEDVIYWAMSSFITFLLLLHQNSGILRWYSVVGVLSGMLVYNITVSRILFHLLKKTAKYFKIKKPKNKHREKRKCKSSQKGKGVTEGAGDTKSAEKRENTKEEERKSE